MKKSLAFLAAMAMTFAATAGTVTWQCYDIMSGASYLDGGIAYLFVGDDVSGVADAIQGGTMNYASSLASTTTDDEGCIDVKKIGSYTSQDVSLYMVVFDTATVTDSSNFKVSSVITQTFGASGNQPFKFTDSIAAATWTPVKASSTPDPIPEPTTVALLALGLAAVGLKRKVA